MSNDKLNTVVKRFREVLIPQLELSREFRLILIEADQMNAAEQISDVLIHLEASIDVLSKIKFE